jgi:hypothetical protein
MVVMNHFKLLIIIVLAIIICLPVSGFGQYRNSSAGSQTQEYLRTTPNLGLRQIRGLLDPSRMHMSHEVSMGFVSAGGISASRGLYMNHLTYQISRPLSITTHLGYQFQPNGPAAWNPATTGDEFVGGADLNWQPSRNSLFRLSVYRGMYPESSRNPWGYNGYRSPYGYSYPGQR